MDINREEVATLIASVVKETVAQLGLVSGNPAMVTPAVEKPKKSAYAKTETLLYNYREFKRIVQERMQEIEEIRVHGVPQRCGTVGERVQGGPVQGGIVLPEESVENAVQRIQRSVQGTVQAISLIDSCMAALKYDPYYKILEMRYFEGRTQEDIAMELGCAQKTISQNKSRLVRELSLRLFPDQVVEEMMN